MRFRTNTHGIRGPEFSRWDEHRILALGCSVALAQYVDQAKTWTALLQRRLYETTRRRIWVGIAARSDITARDVIAFARYLVPQYKDAVDTVLIWVGVNDLALALSKRDDYDPDYVAHMGQDYHIRKAFVRWPDDQLAAFGYVKAAIRRLLSCLKHSLFVQEFAQEGAFYEEKRRARQHAASKIELLPRSVMVGLDEYERNLNRIVDLLRASEVRPLFLTVPSLWKEEPRPDVEELLWFGWVGDSGEYYATSVLARGIDLYNRRLLKVCQERGVECVDLASLLPSSTDVLYDDVHLNVRGSAETAQILSEYFSEHPLTPGRGAKGSA